VAPEPPRPYRRSMLAASAPRPTSAVRLPFSPRARAQVGIFLLAYLVYSAARWVTIGDLGVATVNAGWILELERDLGVATEASVQRALDGTWALWVLNHLYLAAQLLVVPGALVFLYRRARPVYERLRNTILATWLISIPVYAAFPVAPPRLADTGMVDTISSQTGFAMDSSLTTKFYNELAAVPSLHVGFAAVVGIALAAAFRNPIARTVALLWGPVIALAVVATGNHYVFDIAAGVVVSALGYGVGTVAARANTRRPAPATAATALRPAFAKV
jgi:membrane-associated phospholipid phosphatase